MNENDELRALVFAAFGQKAGGGGSGTPGRPGKDGTTFLPAVSAEGVLSWTNNGGKDNPAPVNIKGPQGEKGEAGEKGETGEQGLQGIQGPKGDTGETGPQGPKGDTGEKGETGAEGPQGDKGEAGEKGDPGEGIPAGGAAGQILAKKSALDFDTEWINKPQGVGEQYDDTAIKNSIAAIQTVLDNLEEYDDTEIKASITAAQSSITTLREAVDTLNGDGAGSVSKAVSEAIAALEDSHVEITQAEYDALTPEEKNDGTVYFITDGKEGSGGSADSVDWSDVTNKPNDLVKDADYQHTDNNYSDADKAVVGGVTAALADKVDKEDGKGLSTEDFTTAEKTKLASLENYDDTALSGRVDTLSRNIDNITPVVNNLDTIVDDLQYDMGQVQSALETKSDKATTYTKTETDEKIAEAMTDVDNEHFHVVTVLPDAADAKENHEYVLVTYESDGVTIATEVHYLFYDGAYHQRTTTVSLDGYATEQYVNNKTALMRYKVEMDDAAPPESMVLKGDNEAALQPTMTFAGTDDTLEYSAENESGSYAITMPSKAYVDGALADKQDALTAGQGIRIENSEIDTPLLDSEYFTKGAVLLPDETGDFTVGSDGKISYGEWPDTEFYAAGMALSDFGNYVLEFNTPNGADLYAVTSVSAEETDQYGTSVRINLQNHDGNTMEYVVAKLMTALSTITFSFGSRGVVATSFSVHERRDVRNVSGIVNEDLNVASKTDLADGVAEAKAYADGKTLSATGWGVVTTGYHDFGNASSPASKVVDVSQYGFASADDYEVLLTSGDRTVNVGLVSKTATAFSYLVADLPSHSSGASRPTTYSIIAKGYGAVAYTGALPEGGAAGQALVKRSSDDGDVEWSDTGVGDLTDLTTADQTSLVAAVNELKADVDGLGEPFRVKQWMSNTLNVTIPLCTEEIANTSINKMEFTIDDTEGADYQIVGMIAYEVFDAASGGNRINCWPVCQFTGNIQKTLTVRWMCAGTARKTAKRISAWVLLKHR